MVAEGTFQPFFTRSYIAFQDDFGVGRHHEIHGFGGNELHACIPYETGEQHLIDIRRQRSGSGPDSNRVSPQGYRHFQPVVLALLAGSVMPGADLVGLPVHPGSALVKNLHPVDTVILNAGIGVFGDHERQGYIWPGVHGPALDDRKLIEIYVLAGEYHFLAGRLPYGFWLKAADVDQSPQGTQFVDDPGWRAALHHFDH